MESEHTLTLKDIKEAQAVVARVAHHTPLLPSRTFSEMCGAQVFFKAENFQRTGSFKIRGAANRVAHLTKVQGAKGVIAASAGNHAQGVAMACQKAGIRCTIVMPRGASIAKVSATRGYGAEVILQGENFEESLRHAHCLTQERGLTFIHAFDDADVVAGQGTLGLEIGVDVPEAAVVVVPVGGGGLISGIALALKEQRPEIAVYGVQAEAAPAVSLSFHRDSVVAVTPSPTIADGIAVGRPGNLTLPLMRRYVDDIVTVSEEETSHAMLTLMERAKLVVEGAGAVGLAALLSGRLPCSGKKTVVVLSGGNVDTTLLARILDHGLAHAGRYVVFRVVLLDRPGRLAHVLEAISRGGGNVITVAHDRYGMHIPIGKCQVEITIETRDEAHVGQLAVALQESGYAAQPGQASAATEGVFCFTALDTPIGGK